MPEKANAEIAGWCVIRVKKTGKVECFRHTLRSTKSYAQAVWCYPGKQWAERPHGIEVMPVYVIVTEKGQSDGKS